MRLDRRRRSASRALAQLGVWTVSLALLLVENETLLFTGPLVFALGVFQIVRGWTHRPLLVIGVGNCGAVLLIAATIVVAQLGPADGAAVAAVFGVPWMGVSSVLALRIKQGRPSKRDPLPWDCAHCGYTLVGVAGSACPECGTRFDARKLRRLMREMVDGMGDDESPS